jgi:hypothetical protein
MHRIQKLFWPFGLLVPILLISAFRSFPSSQRPTNTSLNPGKVPGVEDRSPKHTFGREPMGLIPAMSVVNRSLLDGTHRYIFFNLPVIEIGGQKGQV